VGEVDELVAVASEAGQLSLIGVRNVDDPQVPANRRVTSSLRRICSFYFSP
jgi:hypothetical protein